MSDLVERFLDGESVKEFTGELAMLISALVGVVVRNMNLNESVDSDTVDDGRRVLDLVTELQGQLIGGVWGLTREAKRGMWREKTVA